MTNWKKRLNTTSAATDQINNVSIIATGASLPFSVSNQGILNNDVGLRYDAGKLRYDLLPSDGIEELVRVYTKGAEKYADRNWEKGMSWSKVFGSLMRHCWKFWSGETHDPETGCHHMAMAAWNALALCVYDKRKIGEDNRVKINDKL